MANFPSSILYCVLFIGLYQCAASETTGCMSESSPSSDTSSGGTSYTVSTTFTHSCPWNGKLPEMIDVSCTCALTGTMRYSRDNKQVELCDGESWLVMYSFSPGTIHQPANSCQDLYNRGIRQSGVYWIYPDIEVRQPTQVYCEMDFNGGGWLRVYNMMARPGDNTNAAAFYQSITRNDDIRAVSPSSTSVSIYTKGLKLNNYKEVVYGWAASSADVITHYGYYMKTTGLQGECYIDGFCGDNQPMVIMKSSVTNSQRSYKTGSDPNYPHVGIGWSTQQIVWGYDKNASPNGHWANWVDTECCLTANDGQITQAGQNWRYAILIR